MNELACMNCGYPNIFYLHCKIRCTNCGFMLDCSDLDVGGEAQRASQHPACDAAPDSMPAQKGRPQS